jgi:hypothetical protein
LGSFEGSLCDFNGGFGSGTDCGASGKTATKPSPGSFGSGTAEEATGTKSKDVGGAFEWGLYRSGSSGSAGASNVALLLNLTLDVATEQERERSSRAASKTADDGACRAKRGAQLCSSQRASQAGSGSGKRAGDGFSSCTGSAANTLDFGEWLTQFRGEGGFGFSLIANATFAAQTLQTFRSDSPPETFGCGEQGALKLVDARAGAP